MTTVVLALQPAAAFSQALPAPPSLQSGRSIRAAGPGSVCQAFPLHFKASPEETEQYYAKATGVAPLEQVKFLGSKGQKALSADWLTAFVSPFRISTGTTVTDTSDKSDNSAKPETETKADDVMAHFANGGDIYFTFAVPLFSCLPSSLPSSAAARFYVFGLPRLGIVAPALGTGTPTEVTESNFDLGVELYGDWGTKDFKGFGQLRLANQWVSSDFAKTLGLTPSDQSFLLNQMSIGFQLYSIRVSWYKVLSGPEIPFAEYKKGKFLIQITPRKLG